MKKLIKLFSIATMVAAGAAIFGGLKAVSFSETKAAATNGKFRFNILTNSTDWMKDSVKTIIQYKDNNKVACSLPSDFGASGTNSNYTKVKIGDDYWYWTTLEMDNRSNFETKGYSDNTVGKHQFSKFMNEDTVLTGATYSIDKDICVATSGTQKVHVYIKLNEALTGAEALALAESKACDISVTWGSVKDYDFAYVVGNFNMWEDDEAYAMVPNINAEAYDALTFEWYYKGLSADGKAKCRQGTTWSADPDANLVSTKTYNVYWNGKGASVANFAEAA